MPDMRTFFQDQRPATLALLQEMVQIESPTHDKGAVDRMGAFVFARLAGLLAQVEHHPRQQAGDLYLGRLPGRAAGSQILILCHMDTVWPMGTLAERPPHLEGDRYVAPGAADMKGGIAVVLAALDGLRQLDLAPAANLAVLMTGDEETGSLTSRGLIEDLIRQSQLVLCMEPGAPDGALKTARKGGMTVRFTAHGRAAHAGADHASGINAIEEMARQVLALHALTDYTLGTTVSVGKIAGGLATNIVPPECSALVDFRVTRPEERERLDRILSELKPQLPGASLEVQVGEGRPPMPRDEQMIRTFAQAQAIGQLHGLQSQRSEHRGRIGWQFCLCSWGSGAGWPGGSRGWFACCQRICGNQQPGGAPAFAGGFAGGMGILSPAAANLTMLSKRTSRVLWLVNSANLLCKIQHALPEEARFQHFTTASERKDFVSGMVD